MATGRGRAEVVLTPLPVPWHSQGTPSSPRGVPAAGEGPAGPLCPPEQQSLGAGREVKTDYESVSLLCF